MLSSITYDLYIIYEVWVNIDVISYIEIHKKRETSMFCVLATGVQCYSHIYTSDSDNYCDCLEA
jgi:hypothetical protein